MYYSIGASEPTSNSEAIAKPIVVEPAVTKQVVVKPAVVKQVVVQKPVIKKVLVKVDSSSAPVVKEVVIKPAVIKQVVAKKPVVKTVIVKPAVVKAEIITPTVTEELPNSFRPGRKLLPKELAYAKKIFKDSLDYDKIRITRDHWFSYGSTRVIGNTVHFTSLYGSKSNFEDTKDWGLSEEGLETLGHELTHVWQFQHGGWAYALEALSKQAAGAYSTGSRNVAYDWRLAYEEDIPWAQWGPEQQAQAIEAWTVAVRNGNKELVNEIAPYVEKVINGEGAVQLSPIGMFVFTSVGAGIGYLVKKGKGATIGAAIGFAMNLPWNSFFKKKN